MNIKNKIVVGLLLCIMITPSFANLNNCRNWYKNQSLEIAITVLYGRYCVQSLQENNGLNVECLIFKDRKVLLDDELTYHPKLCRKKDLIAINKENNPYYKNYLIDYNRFITINTFIDTYVKLIEETE